MSETENTQETSVENTEQETEETQETQYDLEGFNKHFGSDFKDEGSLREFLNSPSKYEEQLSQKDTELQSALERAQKYDYFIEHADPKKLYGDEDTMRFVSLKQKFPDKDLSLISQVVSPNFEKMSNVDKLVLADKFEVIDPSLSDEDRRRGILRSLRIDADDISELTKEDQYVISREVAKHNELFKSIRDHKPEEGAYNLADEIEKNKQTKSQQLEDRKKKWEPIAKSLLKNFESTKIYDKDEKGNDVEVFSYSVDDTFREKFAEKFLEDLVNSGLEPTKENAQQAMAYIDQQFRTSYFDKIVREAQKAARTKVEDETHKEVHNDREQNTTQREAGGEIPKSIREKFGVQRNK